MYTFIVFKRGLFKLFVIVGVIFQMTMPFKPIVFA